MNDPTRQRTPDELLDGLADLRGRENAVVTVVYHHAFPDRWQAAATWGDTTKPAAASGVGGSVGQALDNMLEDAGVGR